MQKLSIASSDLKQLTIVGCKIYYADPPGNRNINIIKLSENLFTAWKNAPRDYVQLVIIYFKEKYQIWHDDHWDTEQYRQMFQEEDFYWCDGINFSAGNVTEISIDLPPGAIKTGSLIPDKNWWKIYNDAYNDIEL